jgi:hypothetical protein
LLDIQNRIFHGENVRGIDAFFDDSEEHSGRSKGRKKGKTRMDKAAAFDLDASTNEVMAKNQVRELKRKQAFLRLGPLLLTAT